jgi:hypothetical protein
MPYGQETYPVPHPATGSTTASTSPLLCATDPYAGRAQVRRRVLRPCDRAASAASSDPDVSPPQAQKTAEIARLTALVGRSLAEPARRPSAIPHPARSTLSLRRGVESWSGHLRPRPSLRLRRRRPCLGLDASECGRSKVKSTGPNAAIWAPVPICASHPKCDQQRRERHRGRRRGWNRSSIAHRSGCDCDGWRRSPRP